MHIGKLFAPLGKKLLTLASGYHLLTKQKKHILSSFTFQYKFLICLHSALF